MLKKFAKKQIGFMFCVIKIYGDNGKQDFFCKNFSAQIQYTKYPSRTLLAYY